MQLCIKNLQENNITILCNSKIGNVMYINNPTKLIIIVTVVGSHHSWTCKGLLHYKLIKPGGPLCTPRFAELPVDIVMQYSTNILAADSCSDVSYQCCSHCLLTVYKYRETTLDWLLPANINMFQCLLSVYVYTHTLCLHTYTYTVYSDFIMISYSYATIEHQYCLCISNQKKQFEASLSPLSYYCFHFLTVGIRLLVLT